MARSLAGACEDGFHLRCQGAGLVGCYIPNNQIIHSSIIVYESVTHPSHFPPLKLGKLQTYFFRDFFGCFADNLNARLRTSSFRNTSRVVEAACAERNSASRRISRNSSVAMGGIANRRQDQPGLPIVEGLVRDEVDTPPHQAFEQFVKREEIVIRAPLVVEFNIDVDITVAARFAAHERAEDADSPRSKRSEFSDMSLNDSERVPHCVPHRVRHHNVPFKLPCSGTYHLQSQVGRLERHSTKPTPKAGSSSA